jgi:hypothetical protein
VAPLSILVGLLSVVLGTAHAASAQPSALRQVVATGHRVPGGGTFDRFSVESLPILAPVNDRGQVAFFATVARGPTAEGVFLAAAGRILKIAREGDRVPGSGTITGFGRHPIPALNADGSVAFAAAMTGGKTVEGIFLAKQGRLQPVAVAGQSAPDSPSGTFAALDAPALNDRGDVAFLATIRRGRETVEAVWLRAGGRLKKIVAQGDPAPAGGVFAGFGPPALNNHGLVAFGAVIEGRAVPGGIFLFDGKQVRMLAGAGEEAPVGGILAKFSERVALNDAGAVAFTAVLKNAPAAAGIFVAVDGRLNNVAALGDTAPGGGTFSYFGLWPALSASGAVVFTASVDGGPSPVGVFLAEGAVSTRIASVGDTMPGGGKLATLTLYPVAAISPRGDVTFATAPTATGEGAEGIFIATTAR